MKQMRSRFRLLSLLLVCAFLLVFVLCTGNVLKTAGISLDSLSSLIPQAGVSVSPDAAVTPESVPPDEPVRTSPGETVFPENDNTPDPEYNTFGL